MTESALAPTRPILRYHGGKWVLAPWIISNFPLHRVYVEPFGGAGSVLLRKPRAYSEVYNDLDGELVNLFRVARDKGAALAKALLLTPYAAAEFFESYTHSTDTVEQARRTVIRSLMGFGTNSHARKTGFRANSTRSGTTPAHDFARYPDALEAVIARLRGVVIENQAALTVMLKHDGPDTLHYLDPPYLPETRSRPDADYRHEMTVRDHVDLAAAAKALTGMVVLSGYPSPLYTSLYHDWTLIQAPALADGAAPRTECLWLSPAVTQRGIQTSLFEMDGLK